MQICGNGKEAVLIQHTLTADAAADLSVAVIRYLDADAYVPELTPDIFYGINYAVSTLTEREQMLIYLRFVEKKTQKQVGEHLGLSQARVREIEGKTLWELRRAPRLNYITLGIRGFANMISDSAYEQGHKDGYVEGHKQGLEDALKGMRE